MLTTEQTDHELDIQTTVVNRMNAIFGSDLSSLSKLGSVSSSLSSQLEALDNRLDAANSAAPSEVHQALKQCQEIQAKVDHLGSKIEKQTDTAAETVTQVAEFREENQTLLQDIGCVRGLVQYEVWLNLIQGYSDQVEQGLQGAQHINREQTLEAFLHLREARDLLAQSECSNLSQYVKDLVSHWFSLLSGRWEAELEAAISALGWPFVQLEDNVKARKVSSAVTIAELGAIGRSLLQLQEPEDSADKPNQLTLVMKVLMKPLKKRFRYHFLGTKSTNNPGKPEWYTTQLVLWATAHRDFLDMHIQPVYDREGIPLPCRLEFAAALVSLASEKLSLDLPLVQADDILLAHTIDETIVLAKEMAAQLQYSSAQPSVLQPLTETTVWHRWLNMERKFAFEKLDAVLSEGEAWQTEVGDGLLVPKAADSFLAVLLSVTERYKFLAASTHRLDFLELQLQLLEDFRLRLVQVCRAEQETQSPLQSHFCPILCTVEHLRCVLASWGETPFFLQLEHQRLQEEGAKNDIQGTVFDETISKLEYLRSEMVSTLVDSVMFSIRSKSGAYRRDVKWFAVTKAEPEVQAYACLMFQAVAFHLEAGHAALQPAVFRLMWQRLAKAIDTFLVEDLVLENRWCQEGAKQLDTDLRKGLMPIIGAFTNKPLAHFPVLMDCVGLLAAGAGTLLLALESLETETGTSSVTLKELGVSRLTNAQAKTVIATRVDLQL